ncbi:MAG: hypothetical protein NXI10_00785 [bacterium]|nr:hypothetical protein [bacterium]
MKLIIQLLPVYLVTLLSFSVQAQEVDSVNLNGEQVYVYPFKVEVEYSDRYWTAVEGQKLFGELFTYESLAMEQRMSGVPDSMRITRKDFDNFIKAINAKTYKKFKKYYPEMFGIEATRETFEMFQSLREMRSMGYLDEYEEAKIFKSKKFKKALRANPYPFLQQSQNLDQDITPMLDPIPDGKYIQYYEPYCLVQEDGTCKYIEDQIAGYFTMKDNTLHGEATWVNFTGDTIKSGTYNMGLKTGEWQMVYQYISYFDEYDAENFIETGEVDFGYSRQLITFENGVLQGPFEKLVDEGKTIEKGQYDDGQMAGEWKTYHEATDDTYLEENNGALAMRRRYTLNTDDSLVVHPFVIRDGLLPTWGADPDSFNFYPMYRIPSLPVMYRPAFPKSQNFELEEELYDDVYSEMDYYEEDYYDYEEGYYEEEYYGEYGGRGSWDGSYFDDYIYDPNAEERVERGKIFDSLGAYPSYTGVYEQYYPNGQLAYQYNFDDGAMKTEPTIYWDNGQVHDEIVFVPDSNHYVRTIYDYNGREFGTQLYDSSGRYIYQDDIPWDVDLVEIDGLEFYHGGFSDAYNYGIPDSVLQAATDPYTVLSRRWNLIDTSKVHERFYNPETRTADYFEYNIFGDTLTKSAIIYSEGFDSWTGRRTRELGPFTTLGIRSASIYEGTEVDSVPVRMVEALDAYNVDADYTLYYEGEMLTGPMKFDLDGKKLKLGKEEVVIPRNYKKWDKFVEAVTMYRYTDKKLKKKYRTYAELLDNEYSEYDEVSMVFSDFFSAIFSNSFGVYNNFYGDYYWGEGPPSRKDESPYTATIEGYLLNGKPEGIWRSYDQFGNIRTEVNYSKGMLNGKKLDYTYEYPAGEDDMYYFGMEEDSLPEEKTYYLSSELNYKNDLLEGTAYEYTWYGEVTMESNYKEGYRHGLTTERNDKAVSYSEFRDGYRDGYSRTYLTLPGKDSILLFDLNFQNGALQGESVSYHTNGKISKRGFFLSGEPIEDYEGYDSLGFRYHYVKFEYGFPVEEKLWEENELSVRYTFNWEDSIQFIPLDLTESESLDALLVEAGLSGGWEYRPYYGRRTLVDKSDVDYHLTKYFPNDTISRDGDIKDGKKSGYWEFFNYDGVKLYEVNYFDTVLVLNDSIKFKAKGIYTDVDSIGNELFRAYIIEKSERFDCSHKDHYEVRQFYTISEVDDSLGRMNGEVFNYYDNGTLQSYGKMKNGLPEGEWRYYDPAGKLNKYGNYTMGKRNGRWLMGDLSKTKYLGDICLNPNMPDIEEELRYRENFLDIQIINYRLGSARNREYYDINMNQFIELEEEEMDDEIELEEE